MSQAAAALLCSTLAQWLATRDVELPSETLCWAVLPALVQLTRCLWGNGPAGNTLLGRASSVGASARACLFALGVAAACWYRAEEHIVVLFPALTPALLLSGVRPGAFTATESRLFGLPVTTKWGSVPIALFSCLALVRSNGTSLQSLAVCVAVVALLYGGYLAISRPAAAVDADAEDAGDKEGHDDVAEGVEAQDVALPLALCTLPVLAVAMGVRMLILHEPNGPLFRAVVVGCVKALGWFFTLKATRYSSWCVASTIGTFAITSTRIPSSQSSCLHAASRLLASLLSLGQTIRMTTKGTSSRSVLWALGVLPLVPFLASMFDMRALTTPLPRERHPVEALARAAEAAFDAMLERQSRNYTAAEAEYRRRYGMEPPPGFEAWYGYAVARESPIIDEFDMIHEAMAPFLKFSGLRIRENMKGAGGESGVDMWECEFKGQTRETRCKHPTREYDGRIQEMFGNLLGGVPGEMPDVEFLVNSLDEPRVMLQGPESTSDDLIQVSYLSRRPTWDALTMGCPREVGNASSGAQGASVGIDTHGVPFVTDTRADQDLCRHPEYRDMHGIALCPMTFEMVHGAVPVLSPGALSTMADVLYPSPAYQDYVFAYDEEGDVEWDEKRNNLYWAGSTTGAYANDDDEWKKYHRHRFVALAQGLERQRRHWYLHERDGCLHRVASRSLNGSLFDVAFTGVFQCPAEACEAQHAYFDVRPRTEKDAALGSRLVFDTDGNGISGRFVKLLASRSAALKQTLLREWHDERLAAWVHYLPVSQGLGELPELVEWLTGTEAGRRRARAVADRGRAWVARAMRAEDRGVYLYRLMLELARVQDPGRQAM